MDASQIEQLVRRWFVMSVLTERYSGEPQATLSEDVRSYECGRWKLRCPLKGLERAGLSDAFWNEDLMQKLTCVGPQECLF